jgi:hypothetical protein
MLAAQLNRPSDTQLTGLANLMPGTHYPHVTWAHVMLRVQLGCERRFNIEFYGADSLFCHSDYVTWPHVPARLSHFCCRTHFVRSDVRVESRHCSQLFPEMEEMLIEKVRQRTFLCDTKSPDYRDQHMRANAWEEIGKELSSCDVSSRDVRKVCLRFYCLSNNLNAFVNKSNLFSW